MTLTGPIHYFRKAAVLAGILSFLFFLVYPRIEITKLQIDKFRALDAYRKARITQSDLDHKEDEAFSVDAASNQAILEAAKNGYDSRSDQLFSQSEAAGTKAMDLDKQSIALEKETDSYVYRAANDSHLQFHWLLLSLAGRIVSACIILFGFWPSISGRRN